MEQIIQLVITKQIERMLTKAVDYAAEIKAKQIAEEDSINWTGNFHTVVSGYYLGILMNYLAAVMIVMIAVGFGVSVSEGMIGGYIYFVMMTAVVVWLLWISKKTNADACILGWWYAVYGS